MSNKLDLMAGLLHVGMPGSGQEVNDGGPAFPSTDWDLDPNNTLVPAGNCGGMSYRAWLAGVVLGGLCRSYPHNLIQQESAKVADAAVVMADALIARLGLKGWPDYRVDIPAEGAAAGGS